MKNKIVKITILTFAIFCFAKTNAIYALNKFAVLDMKKILNEAPQASAMRDRIQRQFGPRYEKINILKKELLSQIEVINLKKKSVSKIEQKKIWNEINKKKMDLGDLNRKLQIDVKAAQDLSIETLTKQAQEISGDIASEKEIGVVLWKNAAIFDGIRVLDITDQVVEILKKE